MPKEAYVDKINKLADELHALIGKLEGGQREILIRLISELRFLPGELGRECVDLLGYLNKYAALAIAGYKINNYLAAIKDVIPKDLVDAARGIIDKILRETDKLSRQIKKEVRSIVG